MSRMSTRRLARAITAAVALSTTLLLAGCSGSHSAPAASASALPTVKAIGTRVTVPCATLVPSSALSVYGKSFTLDKKASRKPETGTPAATIAGQRGQVCTWKSTSGDMRVTVAVAHLPSSALTRLKNSLFEHSHSVPTYTVEGYFDLQGKTGRADSFPGSYWVNAESTLFTEPGAAQPVMDAVREALSGK
jgi:hypothetical protein